MKKSNSVWVEIINEYNVSTIIRIDDIDYVTTTEVHFKDGSSIGIEPSEYVLIKEILIGDDSDE